MNQSSKASRLKNQSGVTLVELLVSMVISLIILSGIVTVVLSTHRSFETEAEGSFIQENARYSFDMMTRDIRLAGNLGCADIAYSKISNVVKDDVELFSIQPIEGFEASSSAANYPAAMADAVGSDAIIVRYADPETIISSASYNGSSKSFSFLSSNNHSFKKGDYLVAVDATCRNAGLFENTSNDASLSHSGGNNCDNTLYSTSEVKLDCNTTLPATSLKSYENGSEIMKYVVHAYYIADSNVLPETPALKRTRLTSSGNISEELAQGVESMEIIYGIDNDQDGNVDSFVDASVVTEWEDVIAARVELVFRSQTEVLEKERQVTIGDHTFPNDKYLRQLAVATVKVRNR